MILIRNMQGVLDAQFAQLTQAQQQTILGWISKGPAEDRRADIRSYGGVVQEEQYVRAWTYRHLEELEPLLALLPDFWKLHCAQLRKEFANPPQPSPAPIRSANELLSLDIPASPEVYHLPSTVRSTD